MKGMVRNHRLVQSVSDVAFGELCRQIEYKSMLNGIKVLKADRFYPSSKTCSVCGHIKQRGADYPESTPDDLTALLSRFVRKEIATSKVEAGRQHKL